MSLVNEAAVNADKARQNADSWCGNNATAGTGPANHGNASQGAANENGDSNETATQIGTSGTVSGKSNAKKRTHEEAFPQ